MAHDRWLQFITVGDCLSQVVTDCYRSSQFITVKNNLSQLITGSPWSSQWSIICHSLGQLSWLSSEGFVSWEVCSTQCSVFHWGKDSKWWREEKKGIVYIISLRTFLLPSLFFTGQKQRLSLLIYLSAWVLFLPVLEQGHFCFPQCCNELKRNVSDLLSMSLCGRLVSHWHPPPQLCNPPRWALFPTISDPHCTEAEYPRGFQ